MAIKPSKPTKKGLKKDLHKLYDAARIRACEGFPEGSSERMEEMTLSMNRLHAAILDYVRIRKLVDPND